MSEDEYKINESESKRHEDTVLVGPISGRDLMEFLKFLEETKAGKEDDTPMLVRRIYTAGKAADNIDVLEGCVDALLDYSLGDSNDKIVRIGKGMKSLVEKYRRDCLGPEVGRVKAEFRELVKEGSE